MQSRLENFLLASFVIIFKLCIFTSVCLIYKHDIMMRKLSYHSRMDLFSKYYRKSRLKVYATADKAMRLLMTLSNGFVLQLQYATKTHFERPAHLSNAC